MWFTVWEKSHPLETRRFVWSLSFPLPGVRNRVDGSLHPTSVVSESFPMSWLPSSFSTSGKVDTFPKPDPFFLRVNVSRDFQPTSSDPLRFSRETPCPSHIGDG